MIEPYFALTPVVRVTRSMVKTFLKITVAVNVLMVDGVKPSFRTYDVTVRPSKLTILLRLCREVWTSYILFDIYGELINTFAAEPYSDVGTLVGEKAKIPEIVVDKLILSLSTNLHHAHAKFGADLIGSLPIVKISPLIDTEVKAVGIELDHVKDTKVTDFLLADKSKLSHFVSGLPNTSLVFHF